MKKLLAAIAALITLSLTASAMDIVEAKMNETRHLIQTQDLVAAAAEQYIVLYGNAPGSVASLIGVNLLPATFTYTGSLTVNFAGATITVSDTVAAPEPYQSDYYLNPYARKKLGTPSVAGTTFQCVYAITTEALESIGMATAGIAVTPTSPAGNPGDYWFNSRSKLLYYYSTDWTTLNVNKLWIVRDVAELPATSGATGDGAIVLTTTTLVKYLYVNGTWVVIPQAVPFTYNGTF